MICWTQHFTADHSSEPSSRRRRRWSIGPRDALASPPGGPERRTPTPCQPNLYYVSPRRRARPRTSTTTVPEQRQLVWLQLIHHNVHIRRTSDFGLPQTKWMVGCATRWLRRFGAQSVSVGWRRCRSSSSSDSNGARAHLSPVASNAAPRRSLPLRVSDDASDHPQPEALRAVCVSGRSRPTRTSPTLLKPRAARPWTIESPSSEPYGL